MPEEIRIKHERLVERIRNALAGAGMPAPACDLEAEVMVEADLLGVPSHGVRMLPALLRAIREGRVVANPELKVLRERRATCVWDGGNGPGRAISVQAMESAVARAKQHGVGVCLVTRLSHWGRAHAYAFRAAQAGAVGICTTNAIPNMLAFGSSRPLLGNNPLAIGVPGAPGREPIVLDMAMSQAALGKLATFQREKRKVPANWGLDATGQASDDPGEILSSGKVLPFGEHKGAGLALMMELLTGALAGGLFSFEILGADVSGIDPGSSKLFLALDVEAFVERERFAQRVQAFADYLHQAEPGLEISLPGERGWRARAQNLAEGVPLHEEIVEQLRAVGVGLDWK